MGNGGSTSRSSVYQEQNNTIIDTTTINQLNQLVNTTAVNTLIENVKKCSAALLLNQNVRIAGVKAEGDINIDIKQVQNAGLDFSCAQKDEIKSDVVNSMISTIMSQIDQQSQINLINKLQAKVDTSTTSQQQLPPFPWGGSDTSSDVTQKINNYVETRKETNIQNVISNAVYANFTNSNYDECIAQIVAQQGVTIENVQTGGRFTVTINQEQSAKLVAQCVQNANVTVRAVNDIAQYLDLQIKQTGTTTVDSETGAESVATSTTTTSIFPSLGLPDLSSFSGLLSSFSSISLLLICCILILAVIGFTITTVMRNNLEDV